MPRNPDPEEQSAQGTTGLLLRDGNGKLYFRQYDNDGGFTDYSIAHHDLEIKIIDEDAFFYKYDENNCFLDHSPSTLGLDGVLKDKDG